VSVGVAHSSALTALQNEDFGVGGSTGANQAGVTATADGGFVVSWATTNNGIAVIHAAAYDHFGNKVGDVASNSVATQNTAALLASGKVFAVDSEPDGSQAGIFGQIYAAD